MSKPDEGVHWDYEAFWKDRNGAEWEISLEFRVKRGAVILRAIQFASRNSATSVTHAALVEFPLNEIVSDARRQEFEAVVRKKRTSDAHRGRAHSGEELQAVADAYREAVRLGVPVQNAVAETFNVSRSTAAKRIMAARKSGRLRPSGREGET
jgi:hypothetical protein